MMREQLLVLDPALEQLHHGQPQALEIDLADAAGDAARRDAAEIGMVRDVADEPDKLAVVKRRRNGVEIHDVLAAAIGIVGDDHVARREVFRSKGFDQLTHGDLEAGEQARRVMRLRDRLPRRIGDHAGDVLDLGDDGRASGAHQRVAHLVGDLLERVADHLHGDDDRSWQRSTVSTNRPRSGATSAVTPGGMSVAEVASSTTAGPAASCRAAGARV